MEISEGADKIINTSANVQPGENVVIISDLFRPKSLGDSLEVAANQAGGNVIKISYNKLLKNGQLPITAEKAVEMADVLICVTTDTLASTKAAIKCLERGGRIIFMTESTEDTFRFGAIEADYLSFQKVLNNIKIAFDRAEKVRVTAPGGTDLSLSLKDRSAHTCSGLCHEAGELIGLPGIEVYIAPIEEKTNGTLVVDASAVGIGIIKEPIVLTIENGKVVSIKGGEESKKLEKMLKSNQNDNSYIVAEFAIGLNPCGNLVGNISVDEGLYGTGHFALGNNLYFGGKNDAPNHYDLVYWHPTIELDDKLLMKEGVLCDHLK